MSGPVHVLPVRTIDQHVESLDGDPCWCGARYEVLCRECPDHGEPDPDCWRCGGTGLLPSGLQAEAELVIHEDEDPPA